MGVHPEFAAPCGLYCGVCAIRIAGREGNEKLQKRLLDLYQGKVPGKGALPGAENLVAGDIRCGGCLSAEPFMHCGQCGIRNCVEEKGLAGCHDCDAFPCAHIEAFPMAVGKTVILRAVPHRREVGTRQWMEDEQARYVCPECGNKLFRGVMKCNRCQTAVDLD